MSIKEPGHVDSFLCGSVFLAFRSYGSYMSLILEKWLPSKAKDACIIRYSPLCHSVPHLLSILNTQKSHTFIQIFLLQ